MEWQAEQEGAPPPIAGGSQKERRRYYVRIWGPHNNAAQDPWLRFGHLAGPFASRTEAEAEADRLSRISGDLREQRYAEVKSLTALRRDWGSEVLREALEDLERRQGP